MTMCVDTAKPLLDSMEASNQQLESVLGSMLGKQIDFAELFFQSGTAESWSIDDGIVKSGSFHSGHGVGARVISGEKTGFAYSNDIQLSAIVDAAKAAKSIAYHQGAGKIHLAPKPASPALYASLDPVFSLEAAEKVALLQKIDQHARHLDSRVIQVNASISGSLNHMLCLNSEGHQITDSRPLVRLNVSVIVEENGRRERGSAGGGGRVSYQMFIDNDTALNYAEEAVRVALVNLQAKPAPAGDMPIVMAAGWSGVLLHEAVGHGLEADFNRKGVSVFSGRMGEQVTSPLCTIVDDGTLKERRGSLTIDDEGTETESTVLIENGVLRNYMYDKHNAMLMKAKLTGNGRRESYAHLPIPRMTNTYMLAGESEPDEIIASVDKGIYIAGLGGGSVDITSGKFVFSTTEAYLIEKGKIQYPIKGATLVGSGIDVMQNISMVGNDLELDSGVGVCGKDGQSVPVGVGQPTVRVDSMTVGGTKSK